MSDVIVGIDLGTTNSLVGAVGGGKATLFADDNGVELLPSVVGAGPAGQILVGRAASNRRLVDPTGTVVAVKRKMGSEARLRVGNRELSPPEVSALILAALLDRAEQALGKRPARAVITVPAFFNDAQRQATRDAGAIAGLVVERLVNEPTAAALTHQTGAEELVLVYDFGGGTFDVSILERDEGLLEVKTSRGDTQLGGSDIDRALLDHVLSGLAAQRRRVEQDPHAMTRLSEAVERAKIALSDRTRVRLFEPFLTGGEERGAEAINLDTVLERQDVERIARPFIERTLACIDAALRDARLSARDLQRVLLVGGASKMPAVQALVSEHLGRQVLVDDDADRAVALGATLLAGRAAGLEVDEVLVDITPHTLAAGAIVVYGDDEIHEIHEIHEEDLAAVPIIPRDTVLPAERTRTLCTRFDNQEAVMVPIVQGENPLLVGNTTLGQVTVDELPPGPRSSPVEVRFRLDLSGVLEVTATHLSSGKRAHVSIANSPYRLSDQRREAAKRQIEALRANASTDSPSGSGAPTAADEALARALLARAERALETINAELKSSASADRVAQAKQLLENALGSEPSAIGQHAEALSDALLDLA